MSDLLNISNLNKDQIKKRIEEIEFVLANDDQWSREFERSKYLIELKRVYNILLNILNVLPDK